jgi:hypothetical protein
LGGTVDPNHLYPGTLATRSGLTSKKRAKRSLGFAIFRQAAFQWTCDQQAEIEAASPLDHVLIAEEQGRQLEDEVLVHEQGFDRWDGQVFDTRDVFEAWLRWPVPVV